jgi:hypothetical protein
MAFAEEAYPSIVPMIIITVLCIPFPAVFCFTVKLSIRLNPQMIFRNIRRYIPRFSMREGLARGGIKEWA